MRHLPPQLIPVVLIGMFLLLPLIGLRARPHLEAYDLQQANVAMQLHQPQHAVQHLASAATQQPWRPDLWELAGHAALQAGDAPATLAYLKQASQAAGAAAPPDGLSPAALTDLGDAQRQTGDLAAAVSTWQSAAGRSGYPLDLERRILAAHLQLRDYPAAASDLETLLLLQPDEPEWHYRLGLLEMVTDPEQGIAHLTKAASRDSARQPGLEALRRAWLRSDAAQEPAYRLLEIGRGLASLKEWDLAVYALQQAVALRPDYAEAWSFLGEALQHSAPPTGGGAAQPDPALIALQKALELDPGSLSAHTLLSVYWSRHARPDLALKAMQDAAGLDPRNPVLQAQLGQALAAAGEFDQARQTFQLAIDLAPGDPAYPRALALFSLQYHVQVQQIALPIARQLVADHPQDAAALDLMAQVLIQQGDLANAERFARRAIQADASYAPAHLHLALLALLHGDRETGRRELEQALASNPDEATADQASRLMKTYFP